MGLVDRVKRLVRLASTQAVEPSRELGDLIEPGSAAEVSGTSAQGSDGGAMSFEQLEGLRAAGLIDADSFDLIQKTMRNPTAELERLRAAGMMGDEIYAQARATMAAAISGSGSSIDAAELELLQRGESAPATILALAGSTKETNARFRITLEVHPAAGPAYEIECTLAVPHPGGELKVGDFLPVKIDPDDRARVAIDWSRFAA